MNRIYIFTYEIITKFDGREMALSQVIVVYMIH